MRLLNRYQGDLQHAFGRVMRTHKESFAPVDCRTAQQRQTVSRRTCCLPGKIWQSNNLNCLDYLEVTAHYVLRNNNHPRGIVPLFQPIRTKHFCLLQFLLTISHVLSILVAQDVFLNMYLFGIVAKYW